MRLWIAYSPNLKAGFVAPNQKEAEGIASFNAKIHNTDPREFTIREVEVEI